MLARHGEPNIGRGIPSGAAVASTLFLLGCVENQAPGVGAGLSTDMEYVPSVHVGASADRHPARFICGEIKPTQGQPTQVNDPLVSGIYRTMVNVTNVDIGPACFGVAIIPAVIGDDVNTPPLISQGCLQDDEAFNQAIEYDCRWIRRFLTGFNHPMADDDFLTGTLMVQLEDPGIVTVSTTITTLHKQVHGNWIPDLMPQSSCDIVDDALQVTIVNQGEGPAPTTTTRIEIDGSPTIDHITGPLNPDDAVLLDPVPLPDPDPDSISFQVTADADAAVDETDEANNELMVTCEF
jgi:hypothetical protein